MLKNLFFYINLLHCSLAFYDYHYDYMSYDIILNIISEFALNYPQYIQSYSITDKNITFPNLESCGSNKCQFIYYILTDFSQPTQKLNQLPQVFLIAGIHGNEIVGSNALIYMTKYFLDNMNTNDTIKYYIRNRMLIIYPIANPYGFYHNVREEYQYGNYIYDPNRDFPYNLGSDQCYFTATARALDFIFTNYLIKTSISFHGGANSITYPWGSYNHLLSLTPIVSQMAPDNNALDEIAEVLVNIASDNLFMQIERYGYGKMSEIVYPVNGGSEDWAYAAGWENSYSTTNVITKCQNEVNSPNYNISNIRTILFLIECGFLKEPPNSTNGWASAFEDQTNWGHITRNIAVAMALTDLSQPYIKSVEIQSNQLNINISWQGGGCISVDSTRLYYRNSPSNSLNNNITLYNSTNMLNSDKNINKRQISTGAGYWTSQSNKFMESLIFTNETEIDVVIMMSCDSNWGGLVSQSPLIAPQSHLVQSRISDSYFFQHGNFTVNSDKYIFSYFSNIKIINQSNISVNSENINYYSIDLQSKFMSCNPHTPSETFPSQNYLTYHYNDLINFPQNTGFSLKGSISIEGDFQGLLSSNLTAFIFEYADISECTYTNLGKNINVNQFESYYLYFNGTFQNPFFFLSDDIVNTTNEIGFSYEKTVNNLSNFEDLIGRSIIFRSFSVNAYIDIQSQPFYMSYITFSKNYQCENEAEACLGVPLNNKGVCFILTEDRFYKPFTNFMIKVIIMNNNLTTYKNIVLEVIINLDYIKHKYKDFSAINIKNEQNELNISINGINQQTNFITTGLYPFPLSYDFALGNRLAVNIISDNQKIKIGLCDIVYLNSSFNSIDYLITLNTLYPLILYEDNKNTIYEISLGIAIPGFCILCIFFIYLKRKKSQKNMIYPTPGTEDNMLQTPKTKENPINLKKNTESNEDLESGAKLKKEETPKNNVKNCLSFDDNNEKINEKTHIIKNTSQNKDNTNKDLTNLLKTIKFNKKHKNSYSMSITSNPNFYENMTNQLKSPYIFNKSELINEKNLQKNKFINEKQQNEEGIVNKSATNLQENEKPDEIPYFENKSVIVSSQNDKDEVIFNKSMISIYQEGENQNHEDSIKTHEKNKEINKSAMFGDEANQKYQDEQKKVGSSLRYF